MNAPMTVGGSSPPHQRMLSDKSAGAVSDDHNNVVWLDILYVHDAGADIHTIIKGKQVGS